MFKVKLKDHFLIEDTYDFIIFFLILFEQTKSTYNKEHCLRNEDVEMVKIVRRKLTCNLSVCQIGKLIKILCN